MTTSLYIFRAPGSITSQISERFQFAGKMIHVNCVLIATGTDYSHTKAGHLVGDILYPRKFIATNELDLHPELTEIQPMGKNQAEWFQSIPPGKKFLVWAELSRICGSIKKICCQHKEQTILVIINNRIVDAVSAMLRSDKICSLEDLAKIKQEHLDMIAVKLVMDDEANFSEEPGISNDDLQKQKMRLVEPVSLPRWPGDGNPVW